MGEGFRRRSHDRWHVFGQLLRNNGLLVGPQGLSACLDAIGFGQCPCLDGRRRRITTCLRRRCLGLTGDSCGTGCGGGRRRICLRFQLRLPGPCLSCTDIGCLLRFSFGALSIGLSISGLADAGLEFLFIPVSFQLGNFSFLDNNLLTCRGIGQWPCLGGVGAGCFSIGLGRRLPDG